MDEASPSWARRGLSNPALYVRPLASPEAKLLPGTEEASLPFWSPDSKSLAFFTRSELKTVDLAGGRPQVLCPVADARGGAWSSRGAILFSQSQGGGLRQVAPSGGASGRGDDTSAGGGFSPLPPLSAGRGALPGFRLWPGARDLRRNARLERAQPSSCRPIGRAPMRAPGYLVFDRGDTLLAQTLRRRLPALPRRPVRDRQQGVGLVADAYGHSSVSTSDDGTLAYREGALRRHDLLGRPEWTEDDGARLHRPPRTARTSPPTGGAWRRAAAALASWVARCPSSTSTAGPEPTSPRTPEWDAQVPGGLVTGAMCSTAQRRTRKSSCAGGPCLRERSKCSSLRRRVLPPGTTSHPTADPRS